MIKRSVIITAGGTGRRMGAEIPKQFLLLKGKPLIMYTLEKFHAFDPALELIVVLPGPHIPTWETLCQKYFFTLDHKVTGGGTERFHSVRNGLEMATGDIIGIHDAVRPFVDLAVIRDCFEAAEKEGSAVPVVRVQESLRRIERDLSFPVDRNEYRIVQTPQCFKADLIRSAYRQPYDDRFTDDASVVNHLGEQVHLVDGNPENIKITTPYDLKIAEFL